ncbi:MAG: protein-export chaperone SecB [Gammaproteobacteria bacterium]
MAETLESTAGAPLTSPGAGQFALEHIYLKDCSFESPLSPDVFNEQIAPPEASINLQTQINALTNRPEAREVILSVSLEARSAERSLFICEVHMAAVVALVNAAQGEEGRILGARVPEALFPYVRQAVSDLVVRGGFLPVMLQPIDFDAVYQQHATQQGRPLDG